MQIGIIKELLYIFLPIIRAINNVPIFDDLTKISSTDKFFGKSLISEMLYLEHLIDFGIFLINVSGLTMSLSKAKAIVKVLKMELVRKHL